MATAKKTSTPKPAAVLAPPAAKPVAVKKTAAKKVASTVVVEKAPVTVAASSKPATKAKVSAKSKAAPSPAAKAKPSLSPEQRKHYVEVAAFYIAERRGFAPGNPAEDWQAAEQEVDRLIASGQFN